MILWAYCKHPWFTIQAVQNAAKLQRINQLHEPRSSWEADVFSASQLIPLLLKFEGSSSCSQHPDTCPVVDQIKPSLNSPIWFIWDWLNCYLPICVPLVVSFPQKVMADAKEWIDISKPFVEGLVLLGCDCSVGLVFPNDVQVCCLHFQMPTVQEQLFLYVVTWRWRQYNPSKHQQLCANETVSYPKRFKFSTKKPLWEPQISQRNFCYLLRTV